MPIKRTTTITMQVTPLPAVRAATIDRILAIIARSYLFRGLCRSFRHGCRLLCRCPKCLCRGFSRLLPQPPPNDAQPQLHTALFAWLTAPLVRHS